MKFDRYFWWIVGTLIAFVIGLLIFAAYRFGWSRTGFLNKTLWDWMQLLIVPFVLAIVALLFNLATSRNEQKITEQRYQNDQKITAQRYQNDQEIAMDKQREELLQAYLDRMSELLLNNHLRTSVESDEVRYIARARTLAVLPRLDSERKGSLLRFLYESRLINVDEKGSIIQLVGANLKGVFLHSDYLDLVGADLSGADLSGAHLWYANLSGANLSKADLHRAHLVGANLTGTDLSHARLYKADLNSAILTNASLIEAELLDTNLNGANLSKAKLQGAILSNTTLDKANLSGADLFCATLDKVDLSEANLSEANLGSAFLASNVNPGSVDLSNVIRI